MKMLVWENLQWVELVEEIFSLCAIYIVYFRLHFCDAQNVVHRERESVYTQNTVENELVNVQASDVRKFVGCIFRIIKDYFF